MKTVDNIMNGFVGITMYTGGGALLIFPLTKNIGIFYAIIVVGMGCYALVLGSIAFGNIIYKKEDPTP
jgi:hypothetical protein